MESLKRVSIKNFIGSFLVFSIVSILNINYNVTDIYTNVFIFVTITLVIWMFLKVAFSGVTYEIAKRAAFLGGIFSLGFYIYYSCPDHIRIFGIYMSVMAFFHFSEFLIIAIIQPKQVTTDSFVINHSPQYTIAAVTSWIEFFVEGYFCPGMKTFFMMSYIGLVICIAGEVLRKLAMITAGRNFNHLVQCEKAKDHVLVTGGIYSWFRHPSYVGWFYWAVGTQIILLNPICVPAYAVVSWMFFKSRIYIEEITLLNFFGQSYVDYQKSVGIGIPFIKGYQI